MRPRICRKRLHVKWPAASWRMKYRACPMLLRALLSAKTILLIPLPKRGTGPQFELSGGADLACHEVEDLEHLAQVVAAEVDGDVAKPKLLVAHEMVDHRLRPLSQELVAEREAN